MSAKPKTDSSKTKVLKLRKPAKPCKVKKVTKSLSPALQAVGTHPTEPVVQPALVNPEVPEGTPVPTPVPDFGLVLSSSKVKKIVSFHSLNREIHRLVDVLTDARVFSEGETKEYSFSLDTLSADDRCAVESFLAEHRHGVKSDLTNEVLRSWPKDKQSKYRELKKKNMLDYQQDRPLFSNNVLGSSAAFDIVSFNESFDPSFYAAHSAVDVAPEGGAELYKYIVSILSKNKIRFNAKSKICLTAFVEHVLVQVIENSINNCIESKKKIIQLDHVKNLSNCPLKSLIEGLDSYKKISQLESRDTELEHVIAQLETYTTSYAHHFKHYVAGLCKLVETQHDTNISKHFKLFCSCLAVDVLLKLGEMLRVEILSRGIKTVNCNVVCSTLDVYYTIMGIEPSKMRKYVQLKFNEYNRGLVEKKEKNDSRESCDPNDSDA